MHEYPKELVRHSLLPSASVLNMQKEAPSSQNVATVQLFLLDKMVDYYLYLESEQGYITLLYGSTVLLSMRH